MSSKKELLTIKLKGWDTKFFHRKMGALDFSFNPANPMADSALLRELLKAARAAGYRHIICRVKEGDRGESALLYKCGFKLVDTCVELVKELDSPCDRKGAAQFQIRLCNKKDLPTLKEMASGAFTKSYFYRDRIFKRSEANEMHSTWIENLCKRGAARVFVAQINSQAAGFVSCELKDGAGRIPLIAVGKNYRGRGIARELLAYALEWFCKYTTEVHVRTQAVNDAALSLYRKAGFRRLHKDRTYSTAL